MLTGMPAGNTVGTLGLMLVGGGCAVGGARQGVDTTEALKSGDPVNICPKGEETGNRDGVDATVGLGGATSKPAAL